MGRSAPSHASQRGAALGAFRLNRVLGSGAMARVYEGRHIASGIAVAVKVMTATRARAPAYAQAFRNEVEAVARLSHSGIVRVFDFGEVPAGAPEGLDEGAPFLVMELASEGSLDQVGGPGEWRALKALMLALLDALAHAHARGVIHRDLKPANVLVHRRDTTIFKLTDFGIAQAARDDGTSTDMPWAVSGTPPFMAPEQFGGQWRDQGPPTDLYAFGCLAFALVTGTLPFPTTDLPTLARSHALEELPTLVPRFPVPHGFEGWLHVLLAKRASDRFQCAADARFALEQLDDRAVERSSAPGPPLKLLVDTTPLELAPQLAVTPERAWLSKSSPTLVRRQPPPLPPDWRTVAEPRDAPLVGVGAGIFGLRSFPLVDREEERNALWSVLRLVHSDRRPRAVLLRGQAGSGKSSVARWIAERAVEVGGANIMRASHSAQQGTHDGVLAMLARYMRCDGLDRAETRERLSNTLAELGEQNSHIVDALTDLFVAPDDDATRLLDNPAAKAEAKSRLLLHCMRLVAAERPLILVLDDVHWGLDALRLVHLLLRERQSHSPILALLTAREEVLRTRALEGHELDALQRMPGCLEVGIAELSHADQHSLVEQLLGLSGELVERVATRTGGNPLFAVQLVGDWIARGLLVASERGLELRAGSGEHLPDDIHALCAARIEQALATRSEDDRQALELAALLGGEVQETEWARACVILGVLPAGDLPHALARLGLLERGAGSWRFSHGVLRESLERTARNQGRWRAQHRAIAEVLLERYRTAASSELAARIGRHLAETHALDEAHRWLLNAARMLRVENDLERAEALLAEREAVLDRLGAPALDARRAKGDLLAALIDVDRARLDAAEQRARRVLAHARTHGWPLIEAHASLRLGSVMLRREEYEPALQALEPALATLSEAGDRQGEFEARQGIAEVRYYQSSLDAAQAAYRENLAMAEELGDAVAMAESHWGVGYVALWQSRLDEAQQHFQTMRELLAQRGAAYRLVECMNALGEVARLARRYSEAEHYYREALKLSHARGGGDDMSIRINLALVQLFSGEGAMLDTALEPLLDDARQLAKHSATSLILAIQSAVHAASFRWRAFDEALVEIEKLQNERGVRDGDIAMVLRRAADTCRRDGDTGRARQALTLARSQWLLLGRADEAASASADIASLGEE